MNRTELYQKTVDKLLDAYSTGNLEHGNCGKCAVGNICESDKWAHLFSTFKNGIQTVVDKQQIKMGRFGLLNIKSIFFSNEESFGLVIELV